MFLALLNWNCHATFDLDTTKGLTALLNLLTCYLCSFSKTIRTWKNSQIFVKKKVTRIPIYFCVNILFRILK